MGNVCFGAFGIRLGLFLAAQILKADIITLHTTKMGDLAQYCGGLDLNVEVNFIPQKMGLVGKVKQHYCEMLASLEALEKLAGNDQGIKKGVGEFFDEASFNLNRLLLDVLEKSEKLKPKKEKKGESIQVGVPVSGKDVQRYGSTLQKFS